MRYSSQTNSLAKKLSIFSLIGWTAFGTVDNVILHLGLLFFHGEVFIHGEIILKGMVINEVTLNPGPGIFLKF